MKFIILLLVILLIYRFYNIKKQNPNRVDQFPNQPPIKEPQVDDFTDYEELE